MATTARTRVGLIGCGFFARNHLHAWKDLAAAGADLVAVCDVDREKAEAAAREFGVPAAYQDAGAMLAAERLDLVDIVTRMDTHRALALQAIGAGVGGVVVQKPFAPVWADCVAMVEAARRAGTFLAVHENFRFQRPMLEVREVLRSGAIGEPSWARIAFRTGYDVYRTQPYFYGEERLAILDVGIHVLDLARVFWARSSGSPARPSAGTRRCAPRTPRPCCSGTSRARSRSSSAPTRAAPCPTPSPRRCSRSKGLWARSWSSPACSCGSPPAARRSPARSAPPPALDRAAVARGPGERARHLPPPPGKLPQRHPPETSGEDNLKTFALAEAAYAAAAEGRAVRPERVPAAPRLQRQEPDRLPGSIATGARTGPTRRQTDGHQVSPARDLGSGP